MPTDFFDKQTPAPPSLNEQVQQALRAPEVPINNSVIENFGQQIVKLSDDIDTLAMRSGLNSFLIELKDVTASGDLAGAAKIVKKIETEIEAEKKLRAQAPTARGLYAKW